MREQRKGEPRSEFVPRWAWQGWPHQQPICRVPPPPGGLSTLDVGLSARKFPQFWSAPRAQTLAEVPAPRACSRGSAPAWSSHPGAARGQAPRGGLLLPAVGEPRCPAQLLLAAGLRGELPRLPAHAVVEAVALSVAGE